VGLARLVTFLGTGQYASVDYELDGRRVQSRFMGRAAAELFGVREVRILATDAAWEMHGSELQAAISELSGVETEHRRVPDGKASDELWQVFDVLQEEVRGGDGGVVLDITHGFRSLPFFAAACMAYLRAAELLPEPFEVVYGAFEARQPRAGDEAAQGESAAPATVPAADAVAPVWALTPFLELIDWATGVAVFSRTGLAAPLLEVLRAQERARRRELALAGERRFPRTGKLGGALDRFAQDFATVRIASMVTGYAQAPSGAEGPRSSAADLQAALDEYGAEAARFLPALRPLLEKLRAFAEGVAASSLMGAEGDRAMRVLARRYADLRRYAEAAAVVREAWVNRYCAVPAAVAPGDKFNRKARQASEQRWRSLSREARTVADVRNDIEHGGFNEQPLGGGALAQRVGALVETLDATAGTGRTICVTRHAGAAEWLHRRGMGVDEVVAHLDPATVGAGDTVVGTLPVNVVAAICARGARYLHLTVELPAERRGVELSADDLEALGATLEEFRAFPEPDDKKDRAN